MKATKKQRQVLDEVLKGLIIDFTAEMKVFRNNLVNNTLVNEEVNFDHDYEQFAREAFIWKIEYFIAQENLMKETKKLIDGKYE